MIKQFFGNHVSQTQIIHVFTFEIPIYKLSQVIENRFNIDNRNDVFLSLKNIANKFSDMI